MKLKAFVSILGLVFWVGCGSDSHPRTLTASGGSGQSATIDTSFAPLSVTVTRGTTPVSGVSVVFAAPSSGASGTFANGTNTDTEITGTDGVATASVFTANSTPGSYTVTATVSGISGTADFSLTNTVVPTTSYSFYLSGVEVSNDGGNFYALGGSVSIDPAGNVVAGEQDYNDAFGFTSPEPSGDAITGGTLTTDPVTGQGTLTLITDNENLGVGGVETLGVQFVNAKHALVIQFDGSATSSGSMDFQTLPSTFSGNYAFTLSGVDPDYNPIVVGGVFSTDGATLSNGVYDVNDDYEVTLGTSFTGTVTAPDAFGRGTIVVTDLAMTLSYYMVGPEAIRLIDVDLADSGFGSAYGQGSGAFSNMSLGSSVFGLQNNSWGFEYAAAGQIAVSSGGNFTGVADNNEEGTINNAAAISGTYFVDADGYGGLTITSESLDDIFALGIYMTDPTLNLSDPNNTTTGLGGGLVADMDDLIGTGLLVPQTDTTTASFTGNYAFGLQGDTEGELWEFDFLGQGAVAAGTLTGTGMVNDPGGFMGTAGTTTGAAFSGVSTPDVDNAGRYTMPLFITTGVCEGADLSGVLYQASGGQLLFMNEDNNSTSFGSLQQQETVDSVASVPSVKKTAPKANKSKVPIC